MAKKKPYRYPLYLLARFAAGVLYCLPRRVAMGIAKGLGRLGFLVIARQRNKTLKHLRTAMGSGSSETEIQKIAKGVFENALQSAIEILQIQKFANKDVADFLDAGDAYRVYDDLLKEGKGIISITAHMGNWELLAGMFGIKHYTGAVVARRVYYEPYNRWIVGMRQSLNVRTIYREQAAREISALLKRNEIVGMLPDQDIQSLRGVFVPFFGKPAYTPIAPVRLALSTGAPIVVNFLIRMPKMRYKWVLGKVIRPKIETTRDDAVWKYTAEWMAEFEKVIRQYPDQWVWMHDRWKTQPDINDANLKIRRTVESQS